MHPRRSRRPAPHVPTLHRPESHIPGETAEERKERRRVYFDAINRAPPDAHCGPLHRQTLNHMPDDEAMARARDALDKPRGLAFDYKDESSKELVARDPEAAAEVDGWLDGALAEVRTDQPPATETIEAMVARREARRGTLLAKLSLVPQMRPERAELTFITRSDADAFVLDPYSQLPEGAENVDVKSLRYQPGQLRPYITVVTYEAVKNGKDS
jgi:hypothetical protein